MLGATTLGGLLAHVDGEARGSPSGRPHVLYFAHDSNDSRVLHRAGSLAALDIDLTLIAFRRSKMPLLTRGTWRTIDLGETFDYAYFQRVQSILRAVPQLWRQRRVLRDADAVIARNLEQLALARLVQVLSGRSVPLAYECLDIHRLMVGPGMVGRLCRAAERLLMRGCDRLVVSSSAYVDNYFKPVQGFAGAWQLLENKLPASFSRLPRPAAKPVTAGRPLSIGWFGMLRCMKSFEILLALADSRPDAVQIVIRGMPTEVDVANFRARIGDRRNVICHGPYKNPEDLSEIYSEIDVTWAIDFYEEGSCSDWLLPNRLYESGFYGVPLLTRAGTATASYVSELGIGWSLGEPMVEFASAFLDRLRAEELRRVAERVAATSTTYFVDSGDSAVLLQQLTR